jgi:hypothetical protein
MRRVVLMFAVLAAVFVPAVAQKIETQTGDRTRIVHLKTALNHLTVIEVGEPVIQVAAGSPSFKVEWRENKVFVQPTEADAATNLFIWTANQRLNYELEPADSVTNMDFAVDQAPVHLEPVKPTAATTPVPVTPSITELLLTGKPIRLLPSKQRASKPVEVWISDLYEKMAACWSVTPCVITAPNHMSLTRPWCTGWTGCGLPSPSTVSKTRNWATSKPPNSRSNKRHQ